MAIKKILVPTDFSEFSMQAIKYAAPLAIKLKAELSVIHAFHPPTELAESQIYAAQDHFEVQKKHAEKKFQEILDREEDLKVLKPKFLVNMALATDYIISTIDSENIDLTIMGSRGARGIGDEILGSTSYRVIREASSPVLTIPENTEIKTPEIMTFANDLEEIDEGGKLQFLYDFANSLNLRLQILHISTNRGGSGQKVSSDGITAFFEQLEHELYFTEQTDVVSGIQKHIETHKPDLLCILPHRHSLFEMLFHKSVTRQLALHTKIPLLTLR